MHIRRLTLTTLCALAICACDRQDLSSSSGSINEPDYPAEDALSVRTQSRAYIFPHSYTGSAKALVNRVEEKSEKLDATVKTAVLHDKASSTLSADETQSLAALLARGGSLVYCEPTRTGTDALLCKLQSSIRSAIGSGPLAISTEGKTAIHNILNISKDKDGLLVPAFIDDGDTDGVLCDILAVRGGEYQIITDLDEAKPLKVSISGDDESESGSYIENRVEDVPTAYLYGLHADALARWLDSGNTISIEKGSSILATIVPNEDSQSLDEITNAQKISYSYNAYAGHKFEPVTISYEIWAANDGKGSDYYLIHQELRAENSKLVCGPTSEKDWNEYRVKEAFGDIAKDPRAYWAYMVNLGAQAEFSKSNATVEHVSPANNIKGESTYTENMTWSLDGALTITANPSIKLASSLTMSKSWTHNVMDLEMNFSYNGNKPKWDYKAGILPKITRDVNKDVRHDFARPILKSDCTMGHSWIWKISDASDSYSFTSKTWIGLQGLCKDLKKNHQKGGKYKTFLTEDSQTLNLNPPARFEQEWIMTISPYNANTERVMTTYFPKYWLPSFSLYTVKEDDKDSIDAQIAATTAVLTENSKLLEDNKVESFTLSWKPLHGSTVYKTWSYTAPKK